MVVHVFEVLRFLLPDAFELGSHAGLDLEFEVAGARRVGLLR